MQSILRTSARTDSQRNGVSTVELAVCLPVILTIVLGAIELSNLVYLKQGLTIAATEGARSATTSGGTEAVARTRSGQVLAARGIQSATVTISPAVTATTARGQVITVTIQAPAGANSVGLLRYSGGHTVSVSVVMVRQ